MGKLRKYRIECEHTDKTMKMLGKHMRICHIPPHDQGSSKYRDVYVWIYRNNWLVVDLPL